MIVQGEHWFTKKKKISKSKHDLKERRCDEIAKRLIWNIVQEYIYMFEVWYVFI